MGAIRPATGVTVLIGKALLRHLAGPPPLPPIPGEMGYKLPYALPRMRPYNNRGRQEESGQASLSFGFFANRPGPVHTRLKVPDEPISTQSPMQQNRPFHGIPGRKARWKQGQCHAACWLRYQRKMMAKAPQAKNLKKTRRSTRATTGLLQPSLGEDIPLIDSDAEVEADSRPNADSSLARMLNTLALFSTATPSLTADQIAAQLGVPKSTSYRYIQELCKVGLLMRLDRSITLGPRIIELDRCIRECDPVIRAAAPPMRALAEQTGLEVFLSKLYGHSIITVHTEFNDPRQPLRYGRGRPVTISRGASSKALVAFLPAARLRRLHQELALESEDTPAWESFYEEAQKIRRQGYCRTSGELNEGKTGVSAPIFGRGRLVVASVTALGNDSRFALFDSNAIAQLIMSTGQAISARLSADEHL